MNILVVGGKLQGVEVAYLAKKEDWIVYLVDKNATPPAANLCDYFYHVDLFDKETMIEIYKKVDVVIPALEDEEALKELKIYGDIIGLKVICDLQAFHISSSKSRSNTFLKENQIPIPRDFETCLSQELPVVVKPSDSSGSEEVYVFEKPSHAMDLIKANPDYICQEYLEGPSYSLEIIGNGEDYQVLVVTEIIVDDDYDCQRVVAPAILDKKIEREFRNIAAKTAEALKINGIFDIEVIESNGEVYVLEIDARMPSQTPIAVYHATGINMVKELIIYTDNKEIYPTKNKYSILQHLILKDDALLGVGENVMGKFGPLIHKTNYFEADEALISDYKSYGGYVAEIIVTSSLIQEAEAQIANTVKLIEESFR